MIHYTIHDVGTGRLLELNIHASHRFRFKQLVDGEWLPVKFKRAGAKLLAAVSDTVQVWAMPNAQQFHYEYMTQNARALWLSVPMEHDRLVDNMLEYIEII